MFSSFFTSALRYFRACQSLVSEAHLLARVMILYKTEVFSGLVRYCQYKNTRYPVWWGICSYNVTDKLSPRIPAEQNAPFLQINASCQLQTEPPSFRSSEVQSQTLVKGVLSPLRQVTFSVTRQPASAVTDSLQRTPKQTWTPLSPNYTWIHKCCRAVKQFSGSGAEHLEPACCLTSSTSTGCGRCGPDPSLSG